MIICYTGATNKHMIIELFARDNKMHTEIKQLFNYVEYSNDIIQDAVLLIYSQQEDKLLNLCHKNEFHFWLFRVLKNEKINKKSPTNKNYIITEKPEFDIEINSEVDNIIDGQHFEYVNGLAKKELDKIKKNNWYREEIYTSFLKYCELCEENGEKFTYEKFGEFMNIDKDSLWKQVSLVKKQLKNKLNGKL